MLEVIKPDLFLVREWGLRPRLTIQDVPLIYNIVVDKNTHVVFHYCRMLNIPPSHLQNQAHGSMTGVITGADGTRKLLFYDNCGHLQAPITGLQHLIDN